MERDISRISSRNSSIAPKNKVAEPSTEQKTKDNKDTFEERLKEAADSV